MPAGGLTMAQPTTGKIKQAATHPLRRKVLRLYIERNLTSASISEIAEILEEETEPTRYHVEVLVEAEILMPLRGSAQDVGDETQLGLQVDDTLLQILLDVLDQAEAR
jgi:hypothetical protein